METQTNNSGPLHRPLSFVSRLLAGVVFVLLAVSALLSAWYFAAPGYDEAVLFRWRFVPAGLLLLGLVAAACFLVERLGLWRRVSLAALSRALPVYILLLGILWVVLTRTGASHEPGLVSENATAILNGGYASLAPGGYLGRFPHQLGFVLYLELVYRVGGQGNLLAAQLLNCVWLALAYYALAQTGIRLLQDTRTRFYLLVLLYLWLAPVLYTTFVYGILPGLGCITVALWAAVAYVQSGRWWLGAVCAAGCAAAVALKTNYMIFVLAVALYLLAETRRRNARRMLPCAALCLAAALCTGPLLQWLYTLRSGGVADFSATTPSSVWLAMGLQGGGLGPGWYNGLTYTLMESTGHDAVAANAQAWEMIGAATRAMLASPLEAMQFFTAKATSQWNEPTYGALVFVAEYGKAGRGAAVQQLFDNGALAGVVNAYLGGVLLLAYAGAALACLVKPVRRCLPLLPLLVVLGGFGFHLFWEGKSQYILQYALYVVPIAAAGLAWFSEWLGQKYRNKRNTV